MNHSEVVEQTVVEAVIRGSRMVYRSDQSESVHDFDWHYPDGRVAAFEVTASVDEVDVETQAATAIDCRRCWRIRLSSSATTS